MGHGEPGYVFVKDVVAAGQGKAVLVPLYAIQARVVASGGPTLRSDRSVTAAPRVVELSAAKTAAAEAIAAAAEAIEVAETAQAEAKNAKKRSRDDRRARKEAEYDLDSLKTDGSWRTRKGGVVAEKIFNRSSTFQAMKQVAKQQKTEISALERRIVMVERGAKKEQKRAEEWEAAAEREKELKKAAHREKRKTLAEAARLRAQVQRLKGHGGSSMGKTPFKELPAPVQARLSAAEADTDAALQHAEELEAELQALRGEYEGVENEEMRHELWEELGMKGDRYGLRVHDLAMRLLSRRLTAAQAQGTCRDFLATLYPKKTEGKDYRVPDVQRWREWRLWLKPIGRHVAVMALKKAKRFHTMGDATTKKGIGYMGSVHKGEFETQDGNTFVQNIPSGLDVIANGGAQTEADAMCASLESELEGGQRVSLMGCSSGVGDNAANAKLAVDMLGQTKEDEMKLIKGNGDMEEVAEAELNLTDTQHRMIKSAREQWKEMSEEEKEEAEEFHQLTCTNHSDNLTGDKGHSREKEAKSECAARYLATRVLCKWLLRTLRRQVVKCNVVRVRGDPHVLDHDYVTDSTAASRISICNGTNVEGQTVDRIANVSSLVVGQNIDGTPFLDTWDVMVKISLIASQNGRYSDYNINSHRSIKVASADKGLVMRTLPSIQASRQNIKHKLALPIVLSVGALLNWTNTVKIGDGSDAEVNEATKVRETVTLLVGSRSKT